MTCCTCVGRRFGGAGIEPVTAASPLGAYFAGMAELETLRAELDHAPPEDVRRTAGAPSIDEAHALLGWLEDAMHADAA